MRNKHLLAFLSWAWLPAYMMYSALSFSPPSAPLLLGAVQAADTLAFPDAVGYGASAWIDMCDDSVRVIKVTNTNDAGAGSFRAAIDSLTVGGDARKIVVFETSGVITMLSDIDPNNAIKCGYIAGQTAPVEIRGNYRILIEKTDSALIFRYLNMAGWKIVVNGGAGFYFDHLDSKFSSTTTIWITADTSATAGSGEGEVHDVTLSNNLLSMPADASNRHTQIGTADDNQPSQTRTSVWRNFFAHGNHRVPMVNVDSLEFINNLIWNWENRGPRENNNQFIVDDIANRTKGGQATPSNRASKYSISLLTCTNVGTLGPCLSKWYLYGNIYGNNLTDITKTAADMVSGADQGLACYNDQPGGLCTGQAFGDTIQHGDTLFSTTRVAGPSPDSLPINFDIRTGSALEDSILDLVGNTALVDSLGALIKDIAGDSVRDSVASRVLQEFIDSLTVYTADSINIGHGAPSADLLSWTVPTDTDDDGLPNAYEKLCLSAQGIANDSLSLAVDSITPDGRSVIEAYVNMDNSKNWTIYWAQVSDEGVTKYRIFWDDEGTGTYVLKDSTTGGEADTSLSVSWATPTDSIIVNAVNSAGESDSTRRGIVQCQ